MEWASGEQVEMENYLTIIYDMKTLLVFENTISLMNKKLFYDSLEFKVCGSIHLKH